MIVGATERCLLPTVHIRESTDVQGRSCADKQPRTGSTAPESFADP